MAAKLSDAYVVQWLYFPLKYHLVLLLLALQLVHKSLLMEEVELIYAFL